MTSPTADPEKIRGDLNHMLNPAIGFLRLISRDLAHTDSPMDHDMARQIDGITARITAALHVAEHQLGFVPWSDEVEALRSKYGMGPR